MTSTTRTQVYLDHDEHRRLRQLARHRGVPMTQLVREAVGDYLTRHGGPVDAAAAGAPAGPAGLVSRMRARLDDESQEEADTAPPMRDEDRELARELDRRRSTRS